MAEGTEKIDQDFYEVTGRLLSSSSLLNLYNILLDVDRRTKFLNIFKSYTLNDEVTTDIVFYDTYEVENDAWWDNISNDVYGTPFLWWVIALMNNVVNPFEELEPGSNIQILREEHLYVLIKDIERLKEL